MLRKFVANDDEFQVWIEVLLHQFRFQRRERLNDPHQILVRTDSSGIKQEGIRHLISLGQKLPVGIRRVPAEETVVNGVINHLDLVRIYPEDLFNFAFSKVRNRKDSRRMFQYHAREIKM